MKRTPRRDKRAPVIGGVVNGGRGDTTKQARQRAVRAWLREHANDEEQPEALVNLKALVVEGATGE